MATPAPHISRLLQECRVGCKICCHAIAWDAEKKALTLLGDEALAVWLEEQQKDYDVTKAKTIDAIVLMWFVFLDNLHKRSLLSGVSFIVHVPHLKQLLILVLLTQ